MILGIICLRNTTNPTLANVRVQLFQLFCHSRTAIAAKAETGLLLDVGQNLAKAVGRDPTARALPLSCISNPLAGQTIPRIVYQSLQVLQDTVLTPTPFIFTGPVQALVGHNICVAMRRAPRVKSR